MFLLQAEADRKTSSSDVRANMAQGAEAVRASNTKCYRCNKFGHLQTSCPLTEYKMWYCYYCHGIREHKGQECPRADRPTDGYVNNNFRGNNNIPNNNNSNNNNNNRGNKNNNTNFRGRGFRRGGPRGGGGGSVRGGRVQKNNNTRINTPGRQKNAN